jgi:threonine synthase
VSFRTLCPACGAVAPADVFSPFCSSCGSMNDVEYDLDGVVLHDSPNPYLRYRELLPVRDPNLFPRDAGTTPTVHATRLGERVGLPWLYLKDETTLPTGTTKDRMAAVALPYLREGGVEGFCTSSTGNSSTAYAHAITSVRGLQMYLFTAEQFIHRVDVPDGDRVVNFGLRDATFVEAFDAARDYAIANGLTSERGFFNPGRREGLKVAWLEAAEQVPRPIDWYVQAVSSAMGVYGVHRAAVQMHAIGVTDRVPRLLCVQQETCAPMVSAWNDGAEAIRPQDIVERPVGIASAILRGNPTRAYPPVRRIVLDTGGTMVAVSEAEIRNARTWVEEDEGISPCFAAAAAVAGMAKLRRQDGLDPSETVLVNLTGRDRDASQQGTIGPVRWMRRSETGWTSESPGAAGAEVIPAAR